MTKSHLCFGLLVPLSCSHLCLLHLFIVELCKHVTSDPEFLFHKSFALIADAVCIFSKLKETFYGVPGHYIVQDIPISPKRGEVAIFCITTCAVLFQYSPSTLEIDCNFVGLS